MANYKADPVFLHPMLHAALAGKIPDLQDLQDAKGDTTTAPTKH